MIFEVRVAWAAFFLFGVHLPASLQTVAFVVDESPTQFVRSFVIPIENTNLGAAVVPVPGKPSPALVGGEEVVVRLFDPVSRLLLLELAEGQEGIELGQSQNLQLGDSLFLRLEGDVQPSRFVSRESRYGEKPLPLELLRVHHPEGVDVPTGSPLYDSAGRLVAMTYLEANELGNGSLAFPVEAIRRVLEGTERKGTMVRSWFGVELRATDPAPVVQGIREKSPAAKAGLVTGDILLQIGTRKIRSYEEAVNSFYYLLEGKETSVRVLRATEVLDLTVLPELVPQPVVPAKVSEPEEEPEAVEAPPAVELKSPPEPELPEEPAKEE
ncbi:MAG: S1C family serine protease [Verrucomicrobiota bacterium]